MGAAVKTRLYKVPRKLQMKFQNFLFICKLSTVRHLPKQDIYVFVKDLTDFHVTFKNIESQLLHVMMNKLKITLIICSNCFFMNCNIDVLYTFTIS